MPRPIIGFSSPAIEFPKLPPTSLYHMVGPALTDHADPIGDDLAAWLDVQDKSIVYVAFWTMFHYTAKSVRKLEADLLSLDVAIVWSLPEKNQANLLTTEFPPHWTVRTFSPQVSLFKSGQISVFVAHYGSNSVAEALLCGVPMVCCPAGMADQPANASRLARAGVGFIAKKGETATALKELLNNLARVNERSKELVKELESHKGAQQAATLIETISREGDTERMYSGPRRWPWWPVALLFTMLLPTLLAIFL
jgi:UDP:flavonoid glycosyltransferase YjiC (YdhE family)